MFIIKIKKKKIFMLLLLFTILFCQKSQIFAYTPENCSIQISDLTKAVFPQQEPWSFSENYTVIELDNTTGARCLDGSNFKFFYTKGSGSGSNKFMVFWEAGAYCGADGTEFFTSCYSKSLTFLGTSTVYGSNGTNYTNTVPMGFFSNDPEYNPMYYNYNKIYINYCDGTLGLGNLEDPIYFNETWLYFHGFNNTLQTFLYATEHFGFKSASEVVLTGNSGSAACVFMWSSYLQEEGFFSSETKLWAISDAGMFLDTYNEVANCHLFRYYLQILLNITNASALPLFNNCKYRDDEENFYKCVMPQYMYEEVEVPLFIMNAQNDYSQLTSNDYVYCITYGGPFNCSAEEKYRINLRREYLLNIVLGEMMIQKPYWGCWLRTCFEHSIAHTWGWYGNDTVFSANELVSKTAKDALYEWYNEGNFLENGVRYVDLVDWEHNPQCNTNLWKRFILNK